MVLPEDCGITDIGDEVFKDCSKLKSVVIPNGTTRIGHNTFCGCNQLVSAVLPDSVETIDI